MTHQSATEWGAGGRGLVCRMSKGLDRKQYRATGQHLQGKKSKQATEQNEEGKRWHEQLIRQYDQYFI